MLCLVYLLAAGKVCDGMSVYSVKNGKGRKNNRGEKGNIEKEKKKKKEKNETHNSIPPNAAAAITQIGATNVATTADSSYPPPPSS